ncbi:MAG: DUF4430 domain-containing protein [Pelotomaculum sp.]|nr:DUF4430 domain-containing protein [Pelotomaculum sp.]
MAVRHALNIAFKKTRTKKKVFTLSALIFFLLSSVINFGTFTGICSAEPLTSAEMAQRAVEFINEKYQDGEKIDGFAAYVLKLAGEDLASEKWTGSPEYTSNNKTLKSKIEKLADLLGDGNSMITFITGTQNGDGSFGPYANEYGTKAPLQALAAVKADTVGTAVYDQVKSSIDLAVSYFKNGYRSGSMTYDVNGWGFDYRCVEALALAGEDLSVSDWTYNGVSLREAVMASAAATAANPTVKDAVYLAKELTVLCAVCPGSDEINDLADAIIAQANTSVPGQVFFGDNVYDDVLVLTALGKAGRLKDIDQVKALAYLNTFKHSHKDIWGSPAGAAWGGYYQEEPDLTAQVLTALSYFTGAGDQSSDVYQAIKDGLTYLADIQDADTAAVPAQWDSTFATAETLIALKSLGKGYEDYAGAASPWVKKSKTKTIAQCLLALSRWDGSTERQNRLASLLAGRQRTGDPGKGSFENSVYSDMWAYIALGEAGKISSIDTTAAKEYILSKQGEDGSWGETFGTDYYPDFLSTTQAIRALTYLPGADDQQVQAAISKGLDYLKGLQQPDGGVYSGWDDPAVDNSELIVTLKKLGKDPAGADWKNSAGLTPVDYLLNNTMNDDGSFGTSRNVFGAAETLSALLLVGGQGGPGGGGQPVPEPDQCTVKIAVVGMNGERLYMSESLTVSKAGRWGLTALGALDATGLDYVVEENGFVKSIAGQANSGMKGWMYKVNREVPMVSAKDKRVKEGDVVIWWYSTDMNSPSPDWDSLLKGSATVAAETKTTENLPPALQPSKEAGEALNKLAQLLGLKQDTTELGPLGEAVKTVAVVGGDKLPVRAEIAALKKELTENIIDLTQKIEATKGATITDKLGEVALSIQAGALNSDVTITIKEDAVSGAGSTAGSGTPPVPANYRMASPVYKFGPDGTTFTVPATLILKVALPPLARPENLALAWYDKTHGKWIAIPAVVDVSKGLILAKVSHFSYFTVLVKEEKKSFDDVTSSACGWAQDAVEILAGAGVIAGVDGKHYEPERAITRAEVASIMVKALNLPAPEGSLTFKDVPGNQWYYGCVTAAAKEGLLKGYEDGTFCPDRAITREELAAVLVRTLGLKSPSGTELPFTDAGEVSDWAKDSVAVAASAGLVKGYPGGAFEPHGTVTRAECAVMIYRALVDF